MATRDARTTPSPAALVAIIAVVLAVGVGLFLWLFWDDDSAGPEAGATIDDIADDDLADSYVGEEVTVSGEVVASMVPGRAFWIGEEGIGGDRVLIVTSGMGADLEDGTVVEVTGVVGELEATALAEELGLDEADFGPYVEENVIRAQEVAVLDEDG